MLLDGPIEPSVVLRNLTPGLARPGAETRDVPISACAYVQSCDGVSCGDCGAGDAMVFSYGEAKGFFKSNGITCLPKVSGGVILRDTHADGGANRTNCGWASVCPTRDNSVRVECERCPAKPAPGDPLVTLRQSIAWWKEAKLIRSYR